MRKTIITFGVFDIFHFIHLKFILNIKKICEEKDLKTVRLMASYGCVKYRLYDKYFSKICPDVNVKIIHPDNEYQELITKRICNTKNIHKFDNKTSSKKPKNILKKVSDRLKQKVQKLLYQTVQI